MSFVTVFLLFPEKRFDVLKKWMLPTWQQHAIVKVLYYVCMFVKLIYLVKLFMEYFLEISYGVFSLAVKPFCTVLDCCVIIVLMLRMSVYLIAFAIYDDHGACLF